MNVKYTGNALQDSCEMRDLNNFKLFDNTQFEQFIQCLCTKCFICIIYIYENMNNIYIYIYIYI